MINNYINSSTSRAIEYNVLLCNFTDVGNVKYVSLTFVSIAYIYFI